MIDERLRHRAYTREHGDDPPELRNWTWPGEHSPAPPPVEHGEPGAGI
jgi:xylulose-5-phosphate/fructose-6-phosphate phosphoketolase